MSNTKKHFIETSIRSTAGAALALLMAGSGATAIAGQNQAAKTEKQGETIKSKFYCNTKALTPEKRAHQRQLSEKLMAARKEIVETEKGYEFQFSPADVTLGELADWVAAESKCCPFFDFHIDLEREGSLLCLRLTGEEGIKGFIRAEFQVKEMK